MDEEQQEQPQAYITLTNNGQQWQVDSNVQNWEWHILQIAAQIKRAL